MAEDWVVIPAADRLRTEFNGLNEHRDKGADGTKGDANHDSTSDHTPDEESSSLKGRDSDNKNEVHALDIDSTGPWPGTTFDAIIMYILGECRKDNSVGLDRGRIRYIIWNHKIYQAKNGWVAEDYTGSDPHTNHAHFSFEYDTGHYENDVRTYGVIEKFGDDVSEQDVTNALNKFFAVGKQSEDRGGLPESKIGHDAGCQGVPDGLGATKTQYNVIADINKAVFDLGGEIETLGVQLNAKLDELKEIIESHVAGLVEGKAQPPTN